VLAAFGIDRRLRAFVAEDDLPFRKPDPRPILRLCGLLGTSPAETLLVGDGVQDVLAARNAGAPSCAVLQGYTDEDRLRAVGPTLVVARIADLPAALRSLSPEP
jgi:phosphoglycolate phosphatase-like HAD superfamily hydrolase